VIAHRARSIAVVSSLSIAAIVPAWGAFNATYPVRHVHPKDAVALLETRVPDVEASCKIAPDGAVDPATAGQRGVLRISCDKDELRGKIEKALAEIDVPPPTLRLHIVILEASRKEGSTPALPPSELKALDDFRKVMTYRSFRLDGETVIQLDDNAQTQVNDNYNIEMALEPGHADAGSFGIRRFLLASKLPQSVPSGALTYPTYFNTAFSVKRGETVVLGASASAETARVVLVTALP
jgi:hypothetical protein